MSESNEPRDVELGNSLRELPVPDHREHFWHNVTTHLRDAATRGATDQPVAGRRTSRAWALIPAIAALTALVAGVAFLLPRAGNDPIPTVLTEVPEMVTAIAVVTGQGTAERYEIARAIDGSFAETSTTTGDTTAYDAPSRTLVSWSASNGVTQSRRERNLAPGRPDAAAVSSVFDRDLEAFVVAAWRSGFETTTDLVVDGRRVVRYVGPVAPNELAVKGVDSIDAVVDETGVLFSLVRRAGRQEVERIRLESFEVHYAIDRSLFRPDPPAGTVVDDIDHGFEAVESSDAPEEAVGFTLTGAYERRGRGEPSGPEGAKPPGEDIVSWSYRRGWDHVVVTVRRVDTGHVSVDPFASEGVVLDPTSVEVDGIQAQVVIGPNVVPHAWMQAGDIVVTAAGPASRAELAHLLEVAKAA